MNIYFDTEFTGLHSNTTLISIGLVADNGAKFYAELIDYRKEDVDVWLKENVLKNLWCHKNPNDVCDIAHYHIGTKEEIGVALNEWFAQFNDVMLVSDVAHYDMVLLIDLFGTAFDLPKNVSPACHDLNQDIASAYEITTAQAFNVSREGILKEFEIIIPGEKHNALYDAEVIKSIYGAINRRVGDCNEQDND